MAYRFVRRELSSVRFAKCRFVGIIKEAERGVKFQRFPPVLCLHLLRFEYDYALSQHRKINDRYSFDVHLDLSEFLEKPGCSPCSYKLLSILVHSGDNASGHYVSFINPDLDGQVRRRTSFLRTQHPCSSLIVVQIR